MGVNITGIGVTANAIGFNSRVAGGGKVLPPELKNALVGVWVADQNTNDSPNRNIIKNKLKDAGGDFEILNAAYKDNSGYGGWLGLNKNWGFDKWGENNFHINNTVTHTTFLKGNSLNGFQGYIFALLYTKEPFVIKLKIKIKGLDSDDTLIIGQYNHADTGKNRFQLHNGINQVILELENNYSYLSFFTNGKVLSNDVDVDILYNHQGAFCTDGVDDLIVSQKPVSEMLGGSNELTVVSMIHQISGTNGSSQSYNNQIRYQSTNAIRNNVVNTNKTGIYGYSYNGINALNINNILGDKADYTAFKTDFSLAINGRYSVEGYPNNNNPAETSQVAWYWTLIAKRVLTTDEINQVIAYYNLDKYVTPDIYYDVKKQGLTNENHAEFGDKLIDYSGNGKDMQLHNFGWKLDSGVGKYDYDYTNTADFWLNKTNAIFTSSKATVLSTIAASMSNIIFTILKTRTYEGKIKITGLESLISKGEITHMAITSISNNIRITKDGIYDINSGSNTETLILLYSNTKEVPLSNKLIIEQIPSFENALVFDGATDYGQYVGDLGLKDYTVVADREYAEIKLSQVPFISGIVNSANRSPFLLEYTADIKKTNPYSFGMTNNINKLIDPNRAFTYQSTYMYNGNSINKGTSTDTGDGLTFGRYGANMQYAKLCLYNFMLFPYSLSEFLIERQLKKRKLGTLHPNMVEFRPIINSNLSYNVIRIYIDGKQIYTYMNGAISPDNTGKYYPSGATMKISVKCDNILKIPAVIKYNGIKYETIYDGYEAYYIEVPFVKSPQKINIHIDEYIRYEDIVQPYPTVIDFTDENGKIVTWGDKLKVGSTIAYKNWINLFPELYTITGGLSLNGIRFITAAIVEKQMTFSWSNKPTYKLGSNKPKVIYSPSKYSIPNESLRILGYIPDLSGNGNHGKINNSAYAGMSGANGYAVNWSTWTKDSNVTVTDSKITFPKDINRAIWVCYTYESSVPSYKVNIQGIPSDGIISYGGVRLHNGINELVSREGTTNAFGFITSSVSDWSNLIIQQIGKYEGSFCFDGVDDFVSIPSLNSGGKQVLVKINPIKAPTVIYEQRNPSTYTPTFCIFNNGTSIAYQDGNNGRTYLDGILNESLTCNKLVSLTHNILITNTNVTSGNSSSPLIAGTTINSKVGNMALYDFILFNEIDSDETIIKLNEIVGIEGSVFTLNPSVTMDISEAVKSIAYVVNGKTLSAGDLLTNKEVIEMRITLNEGYDIETIQVNDKTVVKSSNANGYTVFRFTMDGYTNQKIHINSFEYIKFESIVQPYPLLYTFADIDSPTKEISYGDKIRVGSTIKVFTGYHLLPTLIAPTNVLFNGNSMGNYSQFTHTVTKDPMIFKCITQWIGEGVMPTFMYNPSMINNIGLKNLGYLPDITGQGNHLQLFNFEYTSESGVTVEDVDFTGLREAGSIKFDGVDDYGTIPTITQSRKCIMMKARWNSLNTLLYDQRVGNSDPFAIYTYNNSSDIAYNTRNTGGVTYIDNVLNKYISSSQLQGITHVLTVCNEEANHSTARGLTVNSNSSRSQFYSDMYLYKMIGFEDVPSDAQRQQLNEWCGIEGNYVQRPEYYWDTYGKTNDDSDKDVLVNRGSASGEYNLALNNFAFEGDSGYNLYPVVFGKEKTYQFVSKSHKIEVTSSSLHITETTSTTAFMYSYVKDGGNLIGGYNKEYPSYRIRITGLSNYPTIDIRYSYLETENAEQKSQIIISKDGIYTIPKSFVATDSLLPGSVWIGYSTMVPSVTQCDITMEVLPEFEGALMLDGIDDTLNNSNIPTLSDYTCIVKRKYTGGVLIWDTCLMYKGLMPSGGGGRNAFILDYGRYSNDKYSFYSYGRVNIVTREIDNVACFTPTKYSNEITVRGEGIDTNGLQIGKWDSYWKGAFYKMIIIPRVIDKLSINMLKNMVDENKFIDISSKIFTDKFNGDFNNDFNKDFLIGNK